MAFYVYILESERDGSLYTGQTSNLPKRLRRHNEGLVRATKRKKPYRLAYFEVLETRREAMWREWELKRKWNTDRKKKLIVAFDQSKITRILGL